MCRDLSVILEIFRWNDCVRTEFSFLAHDGLQGGGPSKKKYGKWNRQDAKRMQ
jgi:hypothetical protein